MPKIQQYTAETSSGGLPPIQQVQASDLYSPGLAQLGQGAGQFIQAYQQKQDIDDVSNVRVKMAEARAQWEQHFRDRSANAEPGDPKFASSFKEDLSKYLGDASEIAQTKKGKDTFNELAANLSGHFAERADVFQAQSAGVKARQDWTTSVNALGASIISDPKSFSPSLKQLEDQINDPNGQFSDARLGKDGKKVRGELLILGRDQLARAYIDGLVDNGQPEVARQILMDGHLDKYLKADDKQRMIKLSDQGITAKRVGEEHASAMAHKAEKDRIAKVNDDLMGDFITDKLTMTKVHLSNLPAFGEGSQRTWMDMIEARTKRLQEKPVKTNPKVMHDLFDKINNGTITDLKPVNAAYLNKDLSEHDLGVVTKWVQDVRNDDGQKLGQAQSAFIKSVTPELDKSTMNRLDEGGSQRVYNFSMYVNEEVKKAREARKAGDAGANPYDLFNPKSPKYLGNSVEQFQTSAQRTQADISRKINQAMDKNKARLPGETPEQYLKRMQ